jgi:SAM-dependent methyltransferase
MSFRVPPSAYDRYMGRYSEQLAPLLASFASVSHGQRVLDVGCGTGALSAELADRVGGEHVAGIEPSAGFAAACMQRVPGADVRVGPAEELPWPSRRFDAALAQLVVSFLADPLRALQEMRRVVCNGGVVAGCSWDYDGQMQMLQTFWDAATALDPDAPDERRTLGHTDPDSLRELWSDAGLAELATEALVVEVAYADFEDYWQPFLSGTGPAGAYCVSLDSSRQTALRAECFARLDRADGPFTLTARAWAVRGIA